MKPDADMKYWIEWGKPLDLVLDSWTNQNRACFHDKKSGRRVWVGKTTMHGNTPFEFLDRLRAELAGKGG